MGDRTQAPATQGPARQGSSVKVELSKHLTDEPFEPHKRTGCGTLRLTLWFTAAGLLIAAIVGLSVTMVLVNHNREASDSASGPASGVPAPPGAVASPPPPASSTGGGGGSGSGSNNSSSTDGPNGESSGGSTSGSGTGQPLAPPATAPFTVPVGWTPLWWDEFNSSSLDSSKWGYDLGNGDWGWGNNESQSYTSSTANVALKNGQLNIMALRDKSGSWTSGRINTLGKSSFYPGMTTQGGSSYTTIHVEASIQVPSPGQGLWPAFWLFPCNLTYGAWPASGEIDAMECINDMSTCGGGLHYGGPPPNEMKNFTRYSPPNGKPYYSTFHTFGFDWSLSAITFYIDGQAVKTVAAANQGNGKAPSAGWWTEATGTSTAAPFDQPMYIILNLAVGGQWPLYPDATTPSPSTMAVNYVRVWAK